MSGSAIKRARKRRFKILKMIRERGAMTRKDVVDILRDKSKKDRDIGDTTVWDDLDWLQANGYVEKKGKIPDGTSGRPPTYWRAIDVGKADE